MALAVAHATWSQVEARALGEALKSWRAAAAPFIAAPAASIDPPADPGEHVRVVVDFARRHFARERAARDKGGNPVFSLQRDLQAAGADVPPDLLARLTAFVTEHAGVYRALDLARADGFESLSSDLLRDDVQTFILIRQFAALRTEYFVLTERGDAAAVSLLVGIGLDALEQRPVAMDVWRGVVSSFRQDPVAQVQRVLSRTRPSASTLERLAAALAQVDEDGQLARLFADVDSVVVWRAVSRAGGSKLNFTVAAAYREAQAAGMRTAGLPAAGGPFVALTRPLVARDLRASIARREAILQAAAHPWPERFAAVGRALLPEPTLRDTLGEASALIYPADGIRIGDGEWHRRELRIAAANQAHVRAARTAVAVERYRRAHGGRLPAALVDLAPAYLDAVPADPFTGTPLRFVPDADGYVVYSVGQDRRDDRGADAGTLPMTRPMQPRLTGDIGVRVTTQR